MSTELDDDQRFLVGLALFAGLKSAAIAEASGHTRAEVRTVLHSALSACSPAGRTVQPG